MCTSFQPLDQYHLSVTIISDVTLSLKVILIPFLISASHLYFALPLLFLL